MKRAVRAQGRTAITASKREGPLSRSNRRDSEGPLTPGKDLKALESDGQTLAALGAACIQHGTAATGLHADQEAMGAGTAGLRRLVGALHDESSCLDV